MGDAMNTAARLEDKSEKGEILVGPETYRLTENLFEYLDRGELKAERQSSTHACLPAPWAKKLARRAAAHLTSMHLY